jgi:hypothetical protein
VGNREDERDKGRERKDGHASCACLQAILGASSVAAVGSFVAAAGAFTINLDCMS